MANLKRSGIWHYELCDGNTRVLNSTKNFPKTLAQLMVLISIDKFATVYNQKSVIGANLIKLTIPKRSNIGSVIFEVTLAIQPLPCLIGDKISKS